MWRGWRVNERDAGNNCLRITGLHRSGHYVVFGFESEGVTYGFAIVQRQFRVTPTEMPWEVLLNVPLSY